MTCAVFVDERDAAHIARWLAGTPEGEAFGHWVDAQEALSSCSDPDVAVPGSRRIVLDGTLAELAAKLRATGDSYCDTLALDVEQCGETV